MFRKRGGPHLAHVKAVESMTDAGPALTAATEMSPAILTLLIGCRLMEHCTTLDYPFERLVVSPSETCTAEFGIESVHTRRSQRRSWLLYFDIGLVSSKIRSSI
jgi:hypothetical protein